MEIWEQISRQRVQHIIESYQLYGDVFDDFSDYLEDLLIAYAPPLIELALIEILVQSWLQIPLIKGIAFIEKVHEQLKSWEYGAIAPKITPSQFRQITGLDPTPVFGSNYNQPSLHKSTY
ncbi:hypothetical protein V2H45_12125 [Tumidithrix elongata RA019]|uniref:Uncharacterized protein n=1 Tax=Tumidithrix elongata BACA0141 TaxID=2716417 RepID=A0AAW9Q4F1_9CYAN|nr:hypothetical protein [Tumidithrix elongata RA019]